MARRGTPAYSRKNASPESQTLAHLRRQKRKEWPQARLGAAVGLPVGMVTQFESGYRSPSLEILYRCAEVMGQDRAEVDLTLFTFRQKSSTTRSAEDLPWGVGAADLASCRRQAAHCAILEAQRLEARFVTHLSAYRLQEARAEADRRYQELVALPVTRQRRFVAKNPRYQTWLVVERLCEASEKAAGKDPKWALFLANLALIAAQNALASVKAGYRMQGYAWIFVGNAKRAGNEFREADKVFMQAEALWKKGEGAEGVLLEEWRLPDMKASLRADQRLWPEALALIGLALASAPEATLGRILMKKAAALIRMGEGEEACVSLDQVKPWVQTQGDPRLLFGWHFNRTASLVQIGRLSEASRGMPEVRRLGIPLGSTIDLAKCDWLEGQIAGEAGRLGEALDLLQRARRDFTANNLGGEAAMVVMDEATFLLKAGETRQVKVLAQESMWILASEGVREEPLKAFRLFCEAALREQATAQLALEIRGRILRLT